VEVRVEPREVPSSSALPEAYGPLTERYGGVEVTIALFEGDEKEDGPTCPGYTCGYDTGDHTITWTGSLTAGASTAITYTGWLSTVIGVGEPLFIVNTAQVDDGENAPFTLSASVAVNPYLVYLPVTLRDF
jgi:hypothetical protein